MGTMIFFFIFIPWFFNFVCLCPLLQVNTASLFCPREKSREREKTNQIKQSKNVLNMYFLGDNDTLQMVGKYI